LRHALSSPGETPVGVLSGVVIVWDALVARLSAPQD
jgi:hypothetical protein